ncbi:phospho-acceptor domain-containing protein [Elizabethkingia sp. YR214]|nr:phospho-acceptor domain-containing protein [Elizabethkingia sp. YR214]
MYRNTNFMYNFFIHFGKQLLILTVVVVFTFQGYWLWNTFQTKKQELLDQTKVEMQQILLNKLMDELAKNPGIKSALGKQDGSVKESYKTNKNAEVIVLESSNLKNSEQIKKFNVPDLKIDSLLYSSIKKSMPVLFRYGDIIVYNKAKQVISTYPTGQTVYTENTTEEVNKLYGKGTFSIHIKNLFATTIYSISWAILFSVFYMILFIGTLFIIYRNLLLNQRLLRNKEVFTRNMTHELKIPVSTILIAAEGLEKYNITNEPEGAKKYAHIIQRAANKLSSLVEAILQNARADEATGKIDLNSVNLLSLLHEVQDSLSVITEDKQAEIRLMDINENINIKGNYEQLKQIFTNLYDNSLKYSDKKPVISVLAVKKNNRIIITIQDNGIGIPRKYEKEIFEPYFRIMNNDLHDVKGFGLGLSFVKSSLKKQNGNIRLLHTTPEGTTIELNIPSYE